MSTLHGLAANALATMLCCCSKKPHPVPPKHNSRSMAVLPDNTRTKPVPPDSVEKPKVDVGSWRYRGFLRSDVTRNNASANLPAIAIRPKDDKQQEEMQNARRVL
jgi:hypothetical protein